MSVEIILILKKHERLRHGNKRHRRDPSPQPGPSGLQPVAGTRKRQRCDPSSQPGSSTLQSDGGGAQRRRRFRAALNTFEVEKIFPTPDVLQDILLFLNRKEKEVTEILEQRAQEKWGIKFYLNCKIRFVREVSETGKEYCDAFFRSKNETFLLKEQWRTSFTTVKSTNNKKECYLDIFKDHSLPAQRDNLFRPAGGDTSGHRFPTLHRKKRLCEEHKTTCYSVCFRKDAGISLEKILPFLSLSHTHILGAHISLCVRGPTCHRASWQPVQSATVKESPVEKVETGLVKIQTSYEKFQTRCSGWVIDAILYLEVNTCTYHPLASSSFIPLPSVIAKKQAIVNIKNTDNKCFLWCVLAVLHPATTNPQRVSNYLPFVKTLNVDQITFPTPLS
ncbi:hypothetical protein AVEN_63852-1 [Araneus ventricosus]|uniref:Uncharacterized protein n=1 Tax=Araneus ventricosus TaxID=182803 RepID=A0A4Y2JQ17_ARAVE|nr:hypothetical protein AVEN_63852-1 [Araneus ventricosus]